MLNLNLIKEIHLIQVVCMQLDLESLSMRGILSVPNMHGFISEFLYEKILHSNLVRLERSGKMAKFFLFALQDMQWHALIYT